MVTFRRTPRPWRATLGAVVVGVGHDPVVLRGLAAAVWDSLDQPAAQGDLVARLLDQWPDATERSVVAVIAELRDRGLVAAE